MHLLEIIDRHFGGKKIACARAIGMNPSSFTRVARGRVPSMSMLNVLKLAQWTDRPLLDFLRLAGKSAEAELLAARLAIPTEAQIPVEDADLLTTYHLLTPDRQGLVRQVAHAFYETQTGAPVPHTIWINNKSGRVAQRPGLHSHTR